MAIEDASRRAEESGLLVARTRGGAERSGGVMGEAVAAMSEIERSSTEITNIIGVIDEIAFQTDLLARGRRSGSSRRSRSCISTASRHVGATW
jgi:methyl-accepting chemotaxis protein